MPKKIDEHLLFETVLKLWVDLGYAGMTTKRVADLAGVNEATLFRRYGGKSELVVAALCAQLLRVPLRDVVPTEDVHADLVRTVEAYLKTHKLVGQIVPLLMMEVSRLPELQPALDVALQNSAFLVRVIQHHQSRGALKTEDPFITLSALIGPLFAAGLFRRSRPGFPMLDVESHVQGFLNGRSADSTPGRSR